MRKVKSDKSLRRRLSYQQYLKNYYYKLLEEQRKGMDFSVMDSFINEVSALTGENTERSVAPAKLVA